MQVDCEAYNGVLCERIRQALPTFGGTFEQLYEDDARIESAVNRSQQRLVRLRDQPAFEVNRVWVNNSDIHVLGAMFDVSQYRLAPLKTAMRVVTEMISALQHPKVSEVVTRLVGAFALELYIKNLRTPIRQPSVISFIVFSCLYKVKFILHHDVNIASHSYLCLDYDFRWLEHFATEHDESQLGTTTSLTIPTPFLSNDELLTVNVLSVASVLLCNRTDDDMEFVRLSDNELAELDVSAVPEFPSKLSYPQLLPVVQNDLLVPRQEEDVELLDQQEDLVVVNDDSDADDDDGGLPSAAAAPGAGSRRHAVSNVADDRKDDDDVVHDDTDDAQRSLTISGYIRKYFQQTYISDADRIVPKRDNTVYYSNDKLDLSQSTTDFLKKLDASTRLDFIMSADVDSQVAFVPLDAMHRWPDSCLQHVTLELTKAPQIHRRLHRTSMMSVQTEEEYKTVIKPMHSIPHAYIGKLCTPVGMLHVYVVSIGFESASALSDRFYTFIQEAVSEERASLPFDLVGHILSPQFGTQAVKTSVLKMSGSSMKQVVCMRALMI